MERLAHCVALCTPPPPFPNPFRYTSSSARPSLTTPNGTSPLVLLLALSCPRADPRASHQIEAVPVMLRAALARALDKAQLLNMPLNLEAPPEH
jgi:hypothetical protein